MARSKFTWFFVFWWWWWWWLIWMLIACALNTMLPPPNSCRLLLIALTRSEAVPKWSIAHQYRSPIIATLSLPHLCFIIVHCILLFSYWTMTPPSLSDEILFVCGCGCGCVPPSRWGIKESPALNSRLTKVAYTCTLFLSISLFFFLFFHNGRWLVFCIVTHHVTCFIHSNCKAY